MKSKALCDVTNIVSCVVGRSQTTPSKRTGRAEKVRASFPQPDTTTAAEPHLQSHHAVHSLDNAAAVEVDDEDVGQQQHEELLGLGSDEVNTGDVPPILWVYNPLYRSPEEETDDSSCGRVRQALTSHPHDENAEEEEEKKEEMEEEQKEDEQKEGAETSAEGQLEPDTLGWVHNPMYVPFKPGRD